MIEGLRARPWILGLVTTLAVVVVWQLTPALGWVDRQFIPPATAVFGSFAAEWGEWAFYPDLLSTLFRILAGFALAAIIGIPLGLAMGYWRMAYRLFGLTVEVLRPIPASALVPVAAIAFGIGHSMHIVVIFIATAVPILLLTVDGVRDVDPNSDQYRPRLPSQHWSDLPDRAPARGVPAYRHRSARRHRHCTDCRHLL